MLSTFRGDDIAARPCGRVVITAVEPHLKPCIHVSLASRLSNLNTAAYQRLHPNAYLIMSHGHSSNAMVMGASECQMEVCLLICRFM